MPLRRVALVLLSLLGLVAAACGGGDDRASPAKVRPFEDVRASELRFEADPDVPDQALFHVTTSEPMICAIVWGETDAFGRFNNSPGMAGTGIIQHDVVLPDVEPGREYRYVIQGTTADGALYRSDVGTFSIPVAAGGPSPPATGPAAGMNVAVGATVAEVSSEFSPAFAAANAIDDDPATEWATKGDGDEGYLAVDLGAPKRVTATEFITRSMTDGTSVTDTYAVTVDGGERLGPFPAGSRRDPRTATIDITGRVFRFDVETSSGGNVGAIEVRVLSPGR